MALFTNLDKGYTKTGGNFFSRLSNGLSYIPVLGSGAALITGLIGAALDAGKWLFRGKFLSAVTAFVSGGTAAAVNSTLSATGLGTAINIGSGITTGETAGTHIRKLTEMGMGGLSGLVGAKPQVLSSYTAGIGSIGGGAAQAGPGKFVSQEAARRGENANAAYARLQSGQADHVAALESAQQQGYSMGGRA